MVKKNVLYKINGHSDRCGFFCMFSSVISYLYNEKDNVYIHWENNLYDKSKNNILDFIFYQDYPKNYDFIDESDTRYWSSDIKKYFDLRPNTRPELIKEFNDKFWGIFSVSKDLLVKINELNYLKKDVKTLAVHIRRSDILSETYFNKYIKWDVNDLNYYYEKIKNEFEEGGYEKIFLCTEDKNIVEFLKDKFSDVIFYQKDVYRVKNGIINNNTSMSSIYNENGKELLLSLMTDVLFASKCEGFLGTEFSGVSIFIEVFNNNDFKKINYFK